MESGGFEESIERCKSFSSPSKRAAHCNRMAVTGIQTQQSKKKGIRDSPSVYANVCIFGRSQYSLVSLETAVEITWPKNTTALDPLVHSPLCFTHNQKYFKLLLRHATPQPQDLSSTFSFQDQWIIIMSHPCSSLCMYDKHAAASFPEDLRCVYIHTLHVLVWIHFTVDWMIRCNVYS